MDEKSSELVSVITPVFNGATYLAEAVQSCLNQTYTNFELLVVNDGSRDSTGAIADRFAATDPRVRVFHIENRGISGARNVALQQARGTFIALLDGDDLWMPDYLSRQMQTLARHPWADVVSANALNLGGAFDGTSYWPVHDEVRPVSLVEMIEREDAIHIMSVFRRAVFDRIGGFEERLRTNEDYQFWLRAAVAGFRFVVDFTPKAYYRRRPNSVSADERRMLGGIMTVLSEIRPLCVDRSPEVKAIERQLARFARRLRIGDARECLAAGDPHAALGHLQRIPPKDRGPVLSVALRIAAAWPSALAYGYGFRRAVREGRVRRARTGT